MATFVTGRCFCGAVRFQSEKRPVAVRACWCRDCQYLSSGNASINAIFKTEAFEITGEVSEYVSRADSGNVMRRRFCPRCGTPLFSESLSRPNLIVVRVGALDDPEIGRPENFIWTASSPSWGFVDSELPNCDGQPAAIPRH
ncbi:GFA family protein [Acidiphilium sp. AL]|uniref:GFA family protein n=1 Tax=Acidiphilium sp. AL TaxID=2871704 RepID=UPI0038D108E9|nr:GFA family protein [Acidiphilium sp. AL]